MDHASGSAVRRVRPLCAFCLCAPLLGCSPTEEPAGPTADSTASSRSPAAVAASGFADPSALLSAALDGSVKGVEDALAAGTPADADDSEGRTALMLAAYNGHREVIELLLERGADANATDAAGRSALMYAASGPFVETVGSLLEAGAEVDAVEYGEGWTALMFAAGEGQKAVVEKLLQAGADPRRVDNDGDTAAAHARSSGRAETAELLQRAASGGQAPG